MSRTAWLLSALLVVACGAPDEAAGPEQQSDEPAAVPVELYFPGPQGRLHSEPRRLPSGLDPAARCERLVELLLEGPESDGLQPPLSGLQAVHVRLLDDGIAYVDLITGEETPNLAMGSTQELLTVYSIVHTIALNVPQAKRVVLLWNGIQPPTFAGHVDTTTPLVPRQGLAAEATRR